MDRTLGEWGRRKRSREVEKKKTTTPNTTIQENKTTTPDGVGEKKNGNEPE